MVRAFRQIFLTLLFALFASQASAIFIQPDTLDPTMPGVGTNRYSYSHNDPIDLSDPTGNRVGDLSVGCNSCDYYDQAEGANGTPSFGEYNPSPEAEAFIEDAYDVIGDVSGLNGALDAVSSAVSGDVSGAAIGAAEVVLGKAKVIKKVSDVIVDVLPSANAARREAMRQQGIPTSQQPVSQSKSKSGTSLVYEVPKPGGGTQLKGVQQKTLDRSHVGEPHWEAGTIKMDPDTQIVRTDRYGTPKLSNDKSSVFFRP